MVFVLKGGRCPACRVRRGGALPDESGSFVSEVVKGGAAGRAREC